MWVNLNEKGKEVWGDIFPYGKVPVTSMVFQESNVGKMVIVAWQALTQKQRDAIVLKISEKSGSPMSVILDDIYKIGLPLRESYTTGVIAAELRFFI